MKKKELQDLAFELDFGIQYMVLSLAKSDGNFASPLLATAYGNMVQAKESLIFIMDPLAYEESDIPESSYIEDPEYIIGSDMVTYDHRIDKFVHIKYLRDGMKAMITKLRAHSDEVDLQPVLYSILNSYIWLRQELLQLKKKTPS